MFVGSVFVESVFLPIKFISYVFHTPHRKNSTNLTGDNVFSFQVSEFVFWPVQHHTICDTVFTLEKKNEV